jgi:hypothetical protein
MFTVSYYTVRRLVLFSDIKILVYTYNDVTLSDKQYSTAFLSTGKRVS